MGRCAPVTPVAPVVIENDFFLIILVLFILLVIVGAGEVC